MQQLMLPTLVKVNILLASIRNFSPNVAGKQFELGFWELVEQLQYGNAIFLIAIIWLKSFFIICLTFYYASFSSFYSMSCVSVLKV